VLVNAVYSLSISSFVSEIFALKFKSFFLKITLIDFCTFLPSQVLRERCPQNLYPIYAQITARHVPKFRWATLFTSKVIGAYLLNIKSIFDSPL